MRPNNTKRSTQNHLKILYENNHLIAVNKCPSDIVQGDKTSDIPLREFIKNYLLKEKYQRKREVFLGTRQQLNWTRSSLIPFAQRSKTLERLNKILQTHQWEKIYWALVKNYLSKDKGTLIHYLVRNSQKKQSTSYDTEKSESKKVVLDYEILTILKYYYLPQIYLHTGQQHQIKSQLSIIDWPIKGEVKYGADRPNIDHNICLHTQSLYLIHTIRKEPLKIIAPSPNETIWKFYEERLEKLINFHLSYQKISFYGIYQNRINYYQ
ncbi:MAG: pseudouridine synthase [Flavobacteriales bacterium AspAUS03]